jgi:hypothetical protein
VAEIGGAPEEGGSLTRPKSIWRRVYGTVRWSAKGPTRLIAAIDCETRRLTQALAHDSPSEEVVAHRLVRKEAANRVRDRRKAIGEKAANTSPSASMRWT